MSTMKQLDDVPEKSHPLHLLDLPLDILKDIVKQVKYSNDLTSLALTCSALNHLATPWIYSRFDIIWPEPRSPPDSNQAVDALTYGLATLAMGETPIDSPAPVNWTPANSSHYYYCGHCRELNTVYCMSKPAPKVVSRRRRGNHYSQYTREFSLGNGHPKWIDGYTIDKESGKMLGTLVALAVARMPSLETFVWDMPTGILRDCWLALESLSERQDTDKPPLEKVWVRFHDNSDIVADSHPTSITRVLLPASAVFGKGQTQWDSALKSPASTNRLLWSYCNVEWPSFSVLPALKSLNVLDIDEPAYLEEMSVLVGRSIESLRELRVGLALDVPRKGFTSSRVYDFPDDHSELATYKEALGLLLSKMNQDNGNEASEPSGIGGLMTSPASQSITPKDRGPDAPTDPPVPLGSDKKGQAKTMPHPSSDGSHCISIGPISQEPTRLKLEVLELERVYVAVPILLNTIDWSVVTCLTLMNCDNHESLWKAFRRVYTPRLIETTAPGSSLASVRRKSKAPAGTLTASESNEVPFSEYRLKLRKLHTNTVSPALIAFLKDTLAPNSLETLIFQDGGMVDLDGSGGRGYYESAISVDTICRGPLRRHRCSLQKVVIDSTHRPPNGITRDLGWRRWKCDRGSLSYITSGKMNALRELSVSLDYKDWHFFLQRLPQIPHVRSIYVTNITDHAHGHHLDMKELALQVMDIVTLRPEVELCYLGISNKCFEILEGKYNDDATVSFPRSETGATSPQGSISGSDEESEEEDDDEDDHDDLDQHPTASGPQHNGNSDSGDESFGESDVDSEGEERREREPNMKLREILFYDEKITIFKARHAKL
ncbi:MAG: hypothetical protein LQ339_001590 [Xanthoria mediterranea]|nr:MAG: hypothetical protein LQ339_001590 [Xanthoria mediterranea]